MAETFKIAIPTEGEGGLDAQRSAHFGHADSFTVVDVSDGTVVGAATLVNPPHEHGGCGQTVALLAAAGVDTAIVVGMGGGPLAAMASHRITALFDDENATPASAVAAFIGGTRTPFGSGNLCKH
jgi:predicted Fe-Mo cluster-binding NifX family protein